MKIKELGVWRHFQKQKFPVYPLTSIPEIHHVIEFTNAFKTIRMKDANEKHNVDESSR